jgi:cysteine desulfurase
VAIYLDYNASAPLCDAAADRLARALRDEFGNASSIHRFGQRAKAAVDEARDRIAGLIAGDASEVVFTGGGTEADNLAVRGAALARASETRRHLVVSALEHEAVLTTARALAREGWSLTEVPCSSDGLVDVERVAGAVTDTTALVSVMLANNETGVVQPVAECARLAHARGAWMHTDAVQAAGKMPVDVRALGVDLLSVSAHKFGGPQGVGALWIRKGLTLRAHMTGGRQERGRRAGTENVAGIAAAGAAAHDARTRLDASPGAVAALRDRLESTLAAALPGLHVNGGAAPRVGNTSNISFEGVEGESLVIALDLDGIAVSTGSACSSGTLEPSHVLRAMGLPSSRVQSAVRFSLGPGTTAGDIDAVIDAVSRRVEKLRRLRSRS